MLIRLWRDTRGTIFPYAAILMVVFVGLGALALDGGRFMSLQTQMQGIADALAIAGARELDQRSGSRARAASAIDTLVNNGLNGLGYSGAITHATPVFYSALPAATAGFGGTPAASDQDAKFVAVTVNPVTLPTIMPIPFFKTGGANEFSTGARAIAGFTHRAVCGISPAFICNPYETSGMSDAQATTALYAALDKNDPAYNPATARKLFRMTATNTSPGHFGWLQPADKCNNTTCLNQWISSDSASALSRSCFDSSGVVLATGNKPVSDAFNDRFDIYATKNGPSPDFTPSINVRKGYKAGPGGDWCNAAPGDYLSAQKNSPAATVPLTQAQAKLGASDANKSAKSITVDTIVGIQNGMSVTSGSTLFGTVNGTPTGTSVPVNLTRNITGGTSLTFLWLTSDLPLDAQWTGLCAGGACLQGNGDWDCLNYWTINHSTAGGGFTKPIPPGCTASNPTISRYQVYKYENDNAANTPTSAPISDYSGYPRPAPANGNGESGAPLCAMKTFTPTYDPNYDPRTVHVAVINCLAQADVIGGGNSGNPVPAGGFAKFFLTQPYNSDNQGYLYGEMTDLVQGRDALRIFNQVQLYR
jgi:Flp pilus assembly protein TadG